MPAQSDRSPPGSSLESVVLEVAGVRTFVRRRQGDGPPAVFLHGNPTHSEDWLPFLEANPGPVIAPDLPGWGRSGRPRDFDYSMHGLAGFFAAFLEEMEVGAHSLIVHDWGSLALIAEQDRAQKPGRLVVINAVPLLPGYRWHWVARMWRRPGVGELFNALTTRTATALLLRRARAEHDPMPPAFVDMIWTHLDRGTKRAILQLYRSADPEALAAAGSRLDGLRCPALVVWGERDPYLPPALGRAYAERLPGAELLGVPAAGHWPWIDAPDVVGKVVAFLAPG